MTTDNTSLVSWHELYIAFEIVGDHTTLISWDELGVGSLLFSISYLGNEVTLILS